MKSSFQKKKKKLNNKARLTHYDREGYLYFNMRDKNILERHMIWSFLINLNSNSGTKSSNYLYYQQLDFNIGDICAANYKPDNLYYRARVIKLLDYDNVMVMFMDYGNCDVVSKFELEPLPNQITQVDPFAVVCRLPNIEIIDYTRYNAIMSDVCQTEVTLIFDRDIFIDRVVDRSDYSEKIIVRLVNFNHCGEDIRAYLIKTGIVKHKEDDIMEVTSSVNPKMSFNDTNQVSSTTDSILLTDSMSKKEKRDIHDNNNDDDTRSDSPVNPIQFNIEYSRSAFITSFHSSRELYIHENSGSIRDKLHSIQKYIDSVVYKYENFTDNIFNKRNVYLTKFSEDMLWYRVKILKFNEDEGFLVQFIDWGNTEYKSSLNDFILLSHEMGPEATFLMEEEGQAQKCRLSKQVRRLFVKEQSLRKFFIKNFIDAVRKIKIMYRIKESHDDIFVINDIQYHNQNLQRMLLNQQVLSRVKPTENDGEGEGEEYNDEQVRNLSGEISSHSDYQEADEKVMHYLMNKCQTLSTNDVGLSKRQHPNDDLKYMNDMSNNNKRKLTEQSSGEAEDGGSGGNNCHIGSTLSNGDCNYVMDKDSRCYCFREYLVTHVCALDEIWIDMSDGQSREMCHNLLSSLQEFPAIKNGTILLGNMYGVRHNKSIYRCRIINVMHNSFLIHLVDTGADISVKFDQLFALSSTVTALPEHICKFSFNEDLRGVIDESVLVSELQRLLLNRTVRIVRQSATSTILMDIIVGNQHSLIQTLLNQRCVILNVDKYNCQDYMDFCVTSRGDNTATDVAIQTINFDVLSKDGSTSNMSKILKTSSVPRAMSNCNNKYS